MKDEFDNLILDETNEVKKPVKRTSKKTEEVKVEEIKTVKEVKVETPKSEMAQLLEGLTAALSAQSNDNNTIIMQTLLQTLENQKAETERAKEEAKELKEKINVLSESTKNIDSQRVTYRQLNQSNYKKTLQNNNSKYIKDALTAQQMISEGKSEWEVEKELGLRKLDYKASKGQKPRHIDFMIMGVKYNFDVRKRNTWVYTKHLQRIIDKLSLDDEDIFLRLTQESVNNGLPKVSSLAMSPDANKTLKEFRSEESVLNRK